MLRTTRKDASLRTLPSGRTRSCSLVGRLAEMTGRIDTAQGELQQMHAHLASLDAVIRQIDLEYKFDAIRPRYRRAPPLGSSAR
jgi:hypothetical protein